MISVTGINKSWHPSGMLTCPGAWCRARSAGFTLVEMMVVLLIIGIIVTFAGLSMRGDPWSEAMREEARRLSALLALAGEEAVMDSREYAVRFDPEGYFFLQLGDGEWVALEGDEIFYPRSLPEGLELYLSMSDSDADAEAENTKGPQVYILSSGEMTPFEVRLSHPEKDYRYEVKGDLMGKLTMEGPLE